MQRLPVAQHKRPARPVALFGRHIDGKAELRALVAIPGFLREGETILRARRHLKETVLHFERRHARQSPQELAVLHRIGRLPDRRSARRWRLRRERARQLAPFTSPHVARPHRGAVLSPGLEIGGRHGLRYGRRAVLLALPEVAVNVPARERNPSAVAVASFDLDAVRQRPHRAGYAREFDRRRLERFVHDNRKLRVGRERRHLGGGGTQFAPVGRGGRIERPRHDPRRIRRIFLPVAYVEAAEHDAVGEHLHQYRTVVLHPRRRAARKSTAPVLQATHIYGREFALPDRPFVAHRAMRVAGDVHGHRMAVQDVTLLRQSAHAARGARGRHMGEGKHRLARVRLLRRRQHLVEPLPIHLPVAPVELRYDHIREALDLALRIRPVRRLDETLHVGERLGGVARAGLARMALVVVGVVPRIDEQLLRPPVCRDAGKRLLHHLAVGDIACRVVVVRHVAVVDDQVNADVAEEFVGEPCARTAFLRLANVRIGHQPYLQQRLLLRRPESRKRHKRSRAADECPSCRLHSQWSPFRFT